MGEVHQRREADLHEGAEGRPCLAAGGPVTRGKRGINNTCATRSPRRRGEKPQIFANATVPKSTSTVKVTVSRTLAAHPGVEDEALILRARRPTAAAAGVPPHPRARHRDRRP